MAGSFLEDWHGPAEVINAGSGSPGTVGFAITFVQRHGTFGSLTFRVFGDKLAEVAVSPVARKRSWPSRGEFYETYSRLLRSVGLCGGALVLQAGAIG